MDFLKSVAKFIGDVIYVTSVVVIATVITNLVLPTVITVVII